MLPDFVCTELVYFGVVYINNGRDGFPFGFAAVGIHGAIYHARVVYNDGFYFFGANPDASDFDNLAGSCL